MIVPEGRHDCNKAVLPFLQSRRDVMIVTSSTTFSSVPEGRHDCNQQYYLFFSPVGVT